MLFSGPRFSPTEGHGASPGTFPIRGDAAPTSDGTTFDPNAYLKVAQLVQRNVGERILSLHHFIGDEIVLDCGSGDGALTAEIARKVPHGFVLGVDANPEMVKKARESFPESDYPNLFFLHGDAVEIASVLQNFSAEFERRTHHQLALNLVFSNFADHWFQSIENHMRHLAGIRYFMDPYARKLAAFSPNHSFPELFDAAYAVMEEPEWKEYFDGGSYRHPRFVTAHEYEEILARMGFAQETFEVADEWFTFKNQDQFVEWIKASIRPFMNRVPEEKQLQFAKDVVCEYAARIPAFREYPALHGDEIAMRAPVIVAKVQKIDRINKLIDELIAGP